MLRRFRDRPTLLDRWARNADKIGATLVLLIFVILPAFIKACSQGAL